MSSADNAAAELARWQGKGLTPQPGRALHEVSFGDASAWVEYEFSPGQPATRDDPADPGYLNIIGILINGAMCDAEEIVPDAILDRWTVEIVEYLASSGDGDDPDSNDDYAADMACDRYERDIDARAAA